MKAENIYVEYIYNNSSPTSMQRRSDVSFWSHLGLGRRGPHWDVTTTSLLVG